MKAVVFHGVGDIRVEQVDEPEIQAPTDAIVRITTSAICGTDLHMVRGTLPGMKPGTVLGHEGVGVVEAIGPGVRNLMAGDRVVIPSTIACGACSYCRAGIYSQCDVANPNGSQAGTAFFGGPASTGPFHGLQAERARVPFAHVGLVKLPDEVTDEQAILVSDIFPTGWFGARLAEVKPGDTVAVFGCGPVGLFAILSAFRMGAGRVFAIDCVPSRLLEARALGAEAIDFEKEDPVEVLRELTGGIGVDRAIDAVGVDAVRAHHGPAAREGDQQARRHETERDEIAPEQHPDGDNWVAGDAPSQAMIWAVRGLAKAGTLGIIGVYPETDRFFPIGEVMNRNVTVRSGNCPHRRYIPTLIDLIRTGAVRPERVLSQKRELVDAVTAFKAFDTRQKGWVKVALQTSQATLH